MAVVILSEADLRRLNEVVPRLYELRSLEAFRKEVLPLLASVVSCDTCSYNEVDLIKGHNEWVTYPQNLKFPGYQHVFDLHIHEHPILRHYTRLRQAAFSSKSDLLGLVTKISDVVNQRQFRRLGIYNEYYRRLRIEHQIAIALAAFADHGLTGCGFALNRSSPDFSERDRLCLNLLRPHLVEAYHGAEAAGRCDEEIALVRRGVERLELGIISLDPGCRVKYMSAGARKHLTRLFGQASLRNSQLPHSIQHWVREQQAPSNRDGVPSVRKPLIIGHGQQQLLVHFLERMDQSLLLLENQSRRPEFPNLASFDLTSREAEVLTWICRGKSNADIAVILSLSVRTIEKHVERILEKLGVETRTAAIVLLTGSQQALVTPGVAGAQSGRS